MVNINEIQKITKLPNGRFYVDYNNRTCTTLKDNSKIRVYDQVDFAFLDKTFLEYVEENKHKGIWEYDETSHFLNYAKAQKIQELEAFENNILNVCVLRLMQGEDLLAEVKTTINEAHTVSLNKQNEKEPFSYEILGTNYTITKMPNLVVQDIFNKIEKYKQARGTYVRHIKSEIEKAQTQEELDDIQFIEGEVKIYAGVPFTLQLLILEVQKAETMDLIETIAVEVEAEEHLIETIAVEVEAEEHLIETIAVE